MAGIVRFLFATMLFAANAIIYGLKVNVSTAIIGMVKSRVNESAGGSNECPEFEAVDGGGAAPIDPDGPFEWSGTQQGLVVGLYFAGYLVGTFPAGYLADRLNAKRVLLASVLCNSILTLLVPIAAREIVALFALRFATGLASSANIPVVNVLVAKWLVYEERSTWVGIIYAGTSIGAVLSITTTGLITRRLDWEWVFYIHGALPLVWCVLFGIFFAEDPESQRYMSRAERELLTESFGHRTRRRTDRSVPWRAIFASGPFRALLLTNTLGNFCWYFLLTQLPLYANKMLRFDATANATVSSVPYLLSAFVNPIIGKALDVGRERGYWNQTGARKIAVAISCVPPSILVIAIAYVGCHRAAAATMLVSSIVISGAIFVGHLANHNDLAPNHAGVLMGITNTPGTVSAFVLPALVGLLTAQGHTFEQWRIIFWIVAVAQMTAFFVFLFFGTAEIQDWNYPEGKPNISGLPLSRVKTNEAGKPVSENSP